MENLPSPDERELDEQDEHWRLSDDRFRRLRLRLVAARSGTPEHTAARHALVTHYATETVYVLRRLSWPRRCLLLAGTVSILLGVPWQVRWDFACALLGHVTRRQPLV